MNKNVAKESNEARNREGEEDILIDLAFGNFFPVSINSCVRDVLITVVVVVSNILHIDWTSALVLRETLVLLRYQTPI